MVDSYARKLEMIKSNNNDEIALTESSVSRNSQEMMMSPSTNSKTSWRISDSSKFYSPREKSSYREYLPKPVNLVVPSKLKSSTLQKI